MIDPQTRRWWEGPNYEGPSDKTVAVVKFETPPMLAGKHVILPQGSQRRFGSGSACVDDGDVTLDSQD